VVQNNRHSERARDAIDGSRALDWQCTVPSRATNPHVRKTPQKQAFPVSRETYTACRQRLAARGSCVKLLQYHVCVVCLFLFLYWRNTLEVALALVLTHRATAALPAVLLCFPVLTTTPHRSCLLLLAAALTSTSSSVHTRQHRSSSGSVPLWPLCTHSAFYQRFLLWSSYGGMGPLRAPHHHAPKNVSSVRRAQSVL
jgi:hypothetical protein